MRTIPRMGRQTNAHQQARRILAQNGPLGTPGRKLGVGRRLLEGVLTTENGGTFTDFIPLGLQLDTFGGKGSMQTRAKTPSRSPVVAFRL